MIVELKNRGSKIIRYLFGNLLVFGSILVAILFIYNPNSSPSNWIIMIPILLIVFALALEWFRATRYFYNYLMHTRGKILSLEPENRLIILHHQQEGKHQTIDIEKVILHTHIKNKLPFLNPKRIDDKVENFLAAKGNNRYSNIWYIELKINPKESEFITPLMINRSKLKLKEDLISYEESPIIKKR